MRPQLTHGPLSRRDIIEAYDLWDNHFPPTDPDEVIIHKAASNEHDDWDGWATYHKNRVASYGIQHYTDDPRPVLDIPEDMLVDHSGRDAVWMPTIAAPDYEFTGRGLCGHRAKLARRREDVVRLVAVAWGKDQTFLEKESFEAVGDIKDYYPNYDGETDATLYQRWM